MSTTPEDLTDDDLLNLLTDDQLAELDSSIAEMFGAEGLDRAEALLVLARVYSMRAAERDEASALALLQLAAAMRRRAERLMQRPQ
ncbi:low temperature requirement protein A [Caulobacter vibrioides]|nr:low temperature requirement protein A [Caulobacter vibrioides]